MFVRWNVKGFSENRTGRQDTSLLEASAGTPIFLCWLCSLALPGCHHDEEEEKEERGVDCPLSASSWSPQIQSPRTLP